MAKRIALEITGALSGNAGYRRYVESFVQALAAEDKENEYLLYGAFWRGCPDRVFELDLPRQRNFRFLLKRLPQRWLLPAEEFLGLRLQERILQRHGVDLLHGLGSWTPKLDKIPSVITLAFAGMLDFRKQWDRFYFNVLTPRSAKQARKVMAISDLARDEALRAWNIVPEKIVTIQYGAPPSQFSPLSNGVKSETRPYFLIVGRTQPHKNALLVGEAFVLLKKAHPEYPYGLLFAGAPGEDQPKLEALFSSAGLLDQVVFAGEIHVSKVHELYQRAFACLVPSVLEGFALPILEAMACGVPVIGVNAKAVPETIADAGIVIEPTPAAMAKAMEDLIANRDLRATLRKRGLERVRLFSWNTVARRTLAVYREVLGNF